MRTIPLPANYRRTSMPAALNGGPDTQVPAELLDEPGPRLVFAPREFTFWEPDPDQEQEAFPRRHRATLVMAPLWYPMRQLAFDLVLEDPDALTDAMWDQDPRSIQRGPVSAVLLKEIQALLARLTGDPTFISPFLARLRNSGNLAQDALWRRETPHGPETRLMLRGGALHWESFEAMSAHRILRMRRHPDVHSFSMSAVGVGAVH